MTRYEMSKVGNNHFTKKVFEDSERLLTRYEILAKNNNHVPTDIEIMKYFNCTKDHLDRCFQLLRTVGVVSYSRNNRIHTLKFLGDYAYLNDYLLKKEESH